MAAIPEFDVLNINKNCKVIALAGNPNVGKSTVFNSLTGLKQHTGNWPGKTVTIAKGEYVHNDTSYILVDIPGTYSLMAQSADEVAARDFICFGDADAVVVVCDATCLERNLYLVLQTLEITKNVVVCVNLLDEAKKKNIEINLDTLSKDLGVPVVGTSARSGKGLTDLMDAIEIAASNKNNDSFEVKYNQTIENAISIIYPHVEEILKGRLNSKWVSLKLIDFDEELVSSIARYLKYDFSSDKILKENIKSAWEYLGEEGITPEKFRDMIVSCIVLTAEDKCNYTVCFNDSKYNERDIKIDRFLTSRTTGIPVMIALLSVVFWITITGANYPSELLSKGLFWLHDRLLELFTVMNAPNWISGILVLGIYRTLAWVVSVMLPPMAIFFPLFTLLEDLGYLPRIAFNLDKYFKKACACGKMALTMCMGLGCNAVGVTGCRIIDSPREQLIAIITNSFVPCNGRFPTLIVIITMFFVGGSVGTVQSILSSVILTLVIVFGVLITFIVSKVLSKTLLKGVPSSFTLELPPYRRPQIFKVILRSILDRTLFVLGRAVAVAAPAGIVIWSLANISIGGVSLLTYCSNFLDPFAKLIGLDGVILMAFFLGFPANEIVFPIIIMAYMSGGSIMNYSSITQLKDILLLNGWTWVTAVCTMLFSLMHFPCSTTFLTIRKETKSLKWTLISFIVPLITGITVCFTVASLARILGLV